MSDFIEQCLLSPRQDTLYILDIDSTLVTTHARNQAILRDFCQEYQERFPEECQQLSKLECRLGDYGYHSSLERHQLNLEELECGETLTRFWREHFFSNRYLSLDQATPGAISWVQTLEQQGAPFVYLTARHHHSMWSGTLDSMNKLGFPMSEDRLYLKKNMQDSDAGYKSQLLSQWVEQGSQDHYLLIDNEPVVLHQILKDLPQTHLCWFDLTHSGKMNPPENAYSIKSFLFGSR